jgi:hypothetical protein
MTFSASAATAAARANDFVLSLGINTHIDFENYGYQNLAIVESSINYLGLKNIRDSAQSASDVQTWLQVSRATGAMFDDYIAETSPAGMVADLGFVQQLAQEGILNYLEGGNEEDDPYAQLLGNTLQGTALFQQQVYAVGHALGLPVINMSFGSGWTAANDWLGNYGSVGDLSAYADFGNAHTYPGTDQGTDWSIQRLNGLATLAASTRPTITTEIGWNASQGFTPVQVATDVLQAAMDGMKAGNAKTYFYALFNDGSGLFGLMNQDGSPTVAGTALHNLTTLLADNNATASTFTTGTLSYSLGGATASDNALVMEKSDGSYWISLWNENDAPHDVTLTIGSPASEIRVFDPISGTTATRDVSQATSVTVSVGANPQLVEMIGATASTLAVVPPPVPVPTPPPPPALTPDDLSVIAPSEEAVKTGARLAVTGVSISDAWAANAAGTMTLNVWDSGGGTITMAGQTASSSGWITVAGTLAQLNADLAGLTYTAGSSAGIDSIVVDIWNQAGVEAQATIGVTISAPPPPASPLPRTITIGASNASPVVNDSRVVIKATAGNHMLFIGGSHDVAILTGGVETVRAYQSYNTITTGEANDSIRVAGSGDVIDAGGGTNQIYDAVGGNTIVMPGAGKGMDHIFGDVIESGDLLDFRTALQATAWNGDANTVGQFIHVSTSGKDAIISISATATGMASRVADLHDAGAVSMTTLLAHSII